MPHQLPPHPLLQDQVKELWYAEREFQPGDVLELLPDGYIELCFSVGNCQIEAGGGWRELPRDYIVGLLNGPVRLRGVGSLRTVAARFYAWGFAPLMGFAVGEPPEALHRLSATLSKLARRLEPLLNADVEAALETLHGFLLERALSLNLQTDQLQAATKLLQTQGGSVRVEELAVACGLSRRQLERRFGQSVGVSPKALARKMRFQQVRDWLWQSPDADLAQLAYELGYTDQAHLNREFKAFSGKTPTQFAAEMKTLRGLGVAIIQD